MTTYRYGEPGVTYGEPGATYGDWNVEAESPPQGVPGGGLTHVVRLPHHKDATGSTRIVVEVRVVHDGEALAVAQLAPPRHDRVTRTEQRSTRRLVVCKVAARGAAGRRQQVTVGHRHHGDVLGAQQVPVAVDRRTSRATGNLLALALVATASTVTESTP